MDYFDLTAKFFFLSNFVLAGISVGLCIALFRQRREIGWLLLGTAFLYPFLTALLRVLQGRHFFTYISHGPVVNGVAQINYNLEFPWFYLLVVLGLVMLWSARRPGNQ